MKSKFVVLFLSALALFATAQAAEKTGCQCTDCKCDKCTCGTEKPASPAAAETAKPAGNPLVGVIVDIMADKQSLLVKHEEIPGVMRAMTMLLRVDEAGLKAAVKGAPVTGTLIRREKIWWLDDVKVAGKE
jgi:Cu/Ag efflux protein CusF